MDKFEKLIGISKPEIINIMKRFNEEFGFSMTDKKLDEIIENSYNEIKNETKGVDFMNTIKEKTPTLEDYINELYNMKYLDEVKPAEKTCDCSKDSKKTCKCSSNKTSKKSEDIITTKRFMQCAFSDNANVEFKNNTLTFTDGDTTFSVSYKGDWNKIAKLISPDNEESSDMSFEDYVKMTINKKLKKAYDDFSSPICIRLGKKEIKALKTSENDCLKEYEGVLIVGSDKDSEITLLVVKDTKPIEY